MARHFFQAFSLSIFVALLTGCGDSSDSHPKDETPAKDPAIAAAESAALHALDIHLEARNSLDPDLIASANNYPNVRLTNKLFYVIDTHEEYQALEENIVMPSMEASEWDHSEWDEIKIIQSSTDKVHLDVIWSRSDEEGNRYLARPQFYIVTNQEGHWGIKLRSPFQDVDLTSDQYVPSDADAEKAALEVVKNYVEARNNRDSDSLAALYHYPHILLDGVELQIFDMPQDYISYEENTVIHGLDYEEWDHSELDAAQVIRSSPNKVHLAFGCEHFDVVGESCGRVEGLWVITKIDDHWAILGRSML